MGRNRLWIAALTLCLAGGLLGGCGSAKKEGGSGGTSLNAGQTAGIRNLKSSILGVTVNGPPVVTFSLTDENGQPLDPTTTGLTTRFTIAQIGADGNYRNYIINSAGQPAFDTGGTYTPVGNGVYSYTFRTDITTNPAFDRGLTHTVAGQITRDVPRVIGSGTFQQAANPYFNFRPDGGAVSVTRELVSSSACNECHGVIRAHGGGRREVALCIVCHYPGPIDPQSNNPIDMRYLIHKIHMGEKLPSNEAGGNFNYVGFQNRTSAFKTVAYPFLSGDPAIDRTPVDCSKCHKQGTDIEGRSFGKDVERWKEAPTRYNCKTCHDTVTFSNISATVTVGRSTLPATPHSGGPAADGTCEGCHNGSGEFGTTAGGANGTAGSAVGAHTIIEQSAAYTGINFQIVSVENAIAGQAPKVTFKVTDNAGNAISPAAPSSFSLKLGYMVGADFLNRNLENYGQPLSQSVTAATANGDGTYSQTFSKPIPAGLTGVGAIGLEGRRPYAFTGRRAGDPNVNIGGMAVQYFFDLATGQRVTDASLQRRQVVDVQKCNKCHTRLTLHGANRVNSTTECAICHNPNGTDRGRRGNLTAAAAADGRTAQSIDLKVMIHKIHSGENLELSKPYVVYAFGNAPVDFSEVRYPNDRSDCLACHISSDTYRVPLPTGVFGNVTSSVGDPLNPADAIRYAPTTSVCTSCHDDAGTTGIHVPVNRRSQDQNNNGIVCSVCHRSGLLLGPDNVHQPVRLETP